MLAKTQVQLDTLAQRSIALRVERLILLLRHHSRSRCAQRFKACRTIGYVTPVVGIHADDNIVVQSGSPKRYLEPWRDRPYIDASISVGVEDPACIVLQKRSAAALTVTELNREFPETQIPAAAKARMRAIPGREVAWPYGPAWIRRYLRFRALAWQPQTLIVEAELERRLTFVPKVMQFTTYILLLDPIVLAVIV